MHCTIQILLCCLIVLSVTEYGYSRADKKSYSENNSSPSNVVKKVQNNTIPKYFKPRNIKRGFGLSAWGIIGLILAIILTGIFIYYIFLFYPILCRKEGKYDVIEHSRDTTPTPNLNNIDKIP